MSDYRTDEEQAEEIRKWLREYGRAVAAGVVIGLAALVGWKLWIDHRHAQAEQASDLYQSLTESAERADLAETERLTAELTGKFAATPYPDLAQLRLAQVKTDAGDLPGAEALLRELAIGARQEALRPLATLRLARVLLAQGRHDEALTELDRAGFTQSWMLLVEELRGDIYRAQGDLAQARAAYDRAVLAAAGNVPAHLIVKRDAAGRTPEGGQS